MASKWYAAALLALVAATLACAGPAPQRLAAPRPEPAPPATPMLAAGGAPGVTPAAGGAPAMTAVLTTGGLPARTSTPAAGGAPSASSVPSGSGGAGGRKAARTASDAFEALGLVGIGKGGRAEGICLCGDAEYWAHHKKEGSSVRQEALQVTGPLPPEVVQRIIRLSFERLRGCYERGRRANPTLAGRIETAFVIDSSGHVVDSHDSAGTNLPDPKVVACVAHELSKLSYPAPEGASVTVTCPLLFGPPE